MCILINSIALGSCAGSVSENKAQNALVIDRSSGFTDKGQGYAFKACTIKECRGINSVYGVGNRYACQSRASRKGVCAYCFNQGGDRDAFQTAAAVEGISTDRGYRIGTGNLGQ